MEVHYKAVPKKNPAKQNDPPKYYAQVISSGELSLRQLVKRVSDISTLSPADTMAAIEALLEVVPQALTEGKLVRLGDFGSFSLQVNSEGVEDVKEMNRKKIKRIAVRFKAGKEFVKVTDAAHLVQI